MRWLTLLLVGCSAPASLPMGAAEDLQAPERFFGHRLGEDRKLARWDRIVEYFRHLDERSDRMELVELGRSTLGKPFLMAAISTPENLKNAERIRDVARSLYAGDGDEAAARALARGGKSIVLFTCNLHSSEIGSSQTAPELAYELVRGRVPLDDVLVLLMPSINPDGQEMIVDWYRKHAGTIYEGGPMPWLYHVYAGHDNNRDFYFLNLVESRLVSDVFYKTWFPHVIVDHHQMGSTGPRMFVPPYDNPVSPSLDPLVSRWLNVFGTRAALDMEAAGLRGVTHEHTFSAYWIGGAMRTPWWHNRIGILTETASARIATPVTVDPSEATERKVKIVTPEPWPGGAWRLRDIIDYQLECSTSVLRTAARHREAILMDAWRMARRAAEAGRAAGEELHVSGPDRGALAELSRILGGLGVDHRRDGAGIHVPLARPYSRLLLELFGKQTYPPNDKPYDVTAWTLSWLLGLAHEYRPRACAEAGEPPPAGGRALDPRDTASALWANRLLKRGVPLFRAADGTFVAAQAPPDLEAPWIAARPSGPGWKLARPRVGLYKPWNASMDEGWTRLVLERFEFSPAPIENRRMREAKLREAFDCVVLPDLSTDVIVDGRAEKDKPQVYPPGYQGGIGKEGTDALKKFVEEGGTLVCLDGACDFAIEKFGLPVKNALKGDKDFSCPGSILKARLDRSHPLARGMPEEAHLFFTNSPALQTSLPPRVDIDRHVVARYAEEESPLASGYLNQPEKLQGRSALVDVTWGRGRVVLFAFRPQHRAQTWGTYKLLFNALFRSASEPSPLPE